MPCSVQLERLEGVWWYKATAEGPPTVINVNNSQCRSVSKHREVLYRKAMHLPRRSEEEVQTQIKLLRSSWPQYPRPTGRGCLLSDFWQSLCKASLTLTPLLPQARIPNQLPGTAFSQTPPKALGSLWGCLRGQSSLT